MIDLSPFVQNLTGKPVAVFGLARSGLSTIAALRKHDVTVFAWDDRAAAREQATALGVEVKMLDQDVLQNCACLVLAPGVPLYYPEPHDVVWRAREADIEIICDIEILYRCRANRKIIGITGTNGKSTTTALLDHVLNQCGLSVSCGGNIGIPVLDMGMPDEDGVFLLELSSYQLDLCPTLELDIAVMLNISPDHLDRHGTMEKYIAAKERIFKGAGASIIGIDDDLSEAMHERVGGITISHSDKIVGEVNNPNLRGDHNRQNIAAAISVAINLGCNRDDIFQAINSFPGLAHRQFLVRTIGDVLYVNDSKATNVEATTKALASYDDIFWIAGGQVHGDDLMALEQYLPRVKHAFLIGETAEKLLSWLQEHNVEAQVSKTIGVALHQAHEKVQEYGQGVVLLSPIYKSWDQFESFEHRGDEFVKLVEAL